MKLIINFGLILIKQSLVQDLENELIDKLRSTFYSYGKLQSTVYKNDELRISSLKSLFLVQNGFFLLHEGNHNNLRLNFCDQNCNVFQPSLLQDIPNNMNQKCLLIIGGLIVYGNNEGQCTIVDIEKVNKVLERNLDSEIISASLARYVNQLACSLANGVIVIISLENGEIIDNFIAHQNCVDLVKISPDGKRLVSSANISANVINLWEKNSANTWILTQNFCDNELVDFEFGLEGLRLLIVKDKRDGKSLIKVYDLESFHCLNEFEFNRCTEPIGSKVSNDGRVFIVPGSWPVSPERYKNFNAIYIVDAFSGKIIRHYNCFNLNSLGIEKNINFSCYDIAPNDCYLMIFSNSGYVVKINLKLEPENLNDIFAEIKKHLQSDSCNFQICSSSRSKNKSICLVS